MLRNTLYGMGYDKVNFGKCNWNPLGDVINPGQTVLLKPNWVSHKNKVYRGDSSLTCLVTHPYLIRAVLDYVVIALKGEGKIILEDAPMQGTGLDEMFELAGYNHLFSFINRKGIAVDTCDFENMNVYFIEG